MKRRKQFMGKLIAGLLAVVVAVSFMPLSADAASKTVKMTAYDQVYKSGKTAYCAGAASIYKVKLTKKGKVRKVTRIMKDEEGVYNNDDRFIRSLKKKGSYVYYIKTTNGTTNILYRVNTKTKKKKQLINAESGVDGYVIKSKKLYCKYAEFDKTYKKSMKLNGKSKKNTSKKIVMKTKKSNAKGYSMKYKVKNGYVRAYLKTPKGTYYLGKDKRN